MDYRGGGYPDAAGSPAAVTKSLADALAELIGAPASASRPPLPPPAPVRGGAPAHAAGSTALALTPSHVMRAEFDEHLQRKRLTRPALSSDSLQPSMTSLSAGPSLDELLVASTPSHHDPPSLLGTTPRVPTPELDGGRGRASYDSFGSFTSIGTPLSSFISTPSAAATPSAASLSPTSTASASAATSPPPEQHRHRPDQRPHQPPHRPKPRVLEVKVKKLTFASTNAANVLSRSSCAAAVDGFRLRLTVSNDEGLAVASEGLDLEWVGEHSLGPRGGPSYYATLRAMVPAAEAALRTVVALELACSLRPMAALQARTAAPWAGDEYASSSASASDAPPLATVVVPFADARFVVPRTAAAAAATRELRTSVRLPYGVGRGATTAKVELSAAWRGSGGGGGGDGDVAARALTVDLLGMSDIAPLVERAGATGGEEPVLFKLINLVNGSSDELAVPVDLKRAREQCYQYSVQTQLIGTDDNASLSEDGEGGSFVRREEEGEGEDESESAPPQSAPPVVSLHDAELGVSVGEPTEMVAVVVAVSGRLFSAVVPCFDERATAADKIGLTLSPVAAEEGAKGEGRPGATLCVRVRWSEGAALEGDGEGRAVTDSATRA